MGKWIRKVLETPIETKGKIIDALGGTKDERINAPSIRAVKEDVFNLIYPVGSIYMSVNNVSPATLFGGEWESLENRFLVGAGSGYSAGSKGGSDSAATYISKGNIGIINTWLSGSSTWYFTIKYTKLIDTIN